LPLRKQSTVLPVHCSQPIVPVYNNLLFIYIFYTINIKETNSLTSFSLSGSPAIGLYSPSLDKQCFFVTNK